MSTGLVWSPTHQRLAVLPRKHWSLGVLELRPIQLKGKQGACRYCPGTAQELLSFVAEWKHRIEVVAFPGFLATRCLVSSWEVEMHAFPRRRRHLSAGVNNHRDLVSGSLAGRSSVLGMPGSALAHKLGLSVVGKALPMPEARVGDGSTREQASRSSHVVEQSSPGPQQAPKSGERVARPGSSSQALPGFCSARTLAQISSVVCADPRPPGIGAPPAEGAVEFEAPSPDSSRISAEVRNSEDVSPVLVNRSMISGNGPNLSPGFESAAALAGWDFNSLLLAASLRENDEDNQSTHSERGVELPVQRTPDPGRRDNIRSLSCNCGVCRSCTDRKRVERTPGHASTPVSANRR